MKPTQEILERIRDLAGLKIPKDLPLPVRYDGTRYYWGNASEMVADFDNGVNTGDGFRIRGWGRIQDEERQDQCARFIERAINAYAQPQLNDLLRVIDKQKGGKTVSIGLYSDGKLSVIDYSDMQEDNSKECGYDLTLTVEQNLETNPDLRSLISNLIF